VIVYIFMTGHPDTNLRSSVPITQALVLAAELASAAEKDTLSEHKLV
jgi:hypothetical protein